MRELLETAREAVLDGEIVILCTVVRLEGSGYGRPGARMVLTESGERLGYISGGCLEKDLRRRVWAETESGPKLLAFDTRGNALPARSAYNTGCEGVVYVLAQRINSVNHPALSVPLRSQKEHTPIVMATVYRSERSDISAGQHLGHRDTAGLQSYNLAHEILELLEPIMEDCWELRRSSTAEITSETGSIEVALEYLQPQPRLIIFGVGDDVMPVSNLAVTMDWDVTVVGERPELAHPSRFPKATIACQSLRQFAEDFAFRPGDEVLLLTHNIDSDAELLPILINRDVKSIGLLGSKRRLAKLLARMHEHGHHLSDEQLSLLRSPVGLDIGAQTPQEIAVSIVAEILARRNKRTKTSLGSLDRPLHERETRLRVDGTNRRLQHVEFLAESAQ
ncbi:XdhC family protein [Lacunimicrobium album]